MLIAIIILCVLQAVTMIALFFVGSGGGKFIIDYTNAENKRDEIIDDLVQQGNKAYRDIIRLTNQVESLNRHVVRKQ